MKWWVVGKNMDVKGKADEISEGSEECSRESFYHLRAYMYCHEQNFGRNMNVRRFFWGGLRRK